jgi:signal transduction histidine kinase
VRVGRNEDGLYVADDGPGVAGGAADVFDHGYTTSEDGTGPGLAIVEEIAETHRWAVTVTESAGGARLDVHGVAID